MRLHALCIVVLAACQPPPEPADPPGAGTGDYDWPAGDHDLPAGDDDWPAGDHDVPPGGDAAAPGDPGVPAPAAIHFGYYRVDNAPSGRGSHGATVREWTNIAYVDWYADARAFDHDPGSDMTVVRENMDGILARLTGEGLDVVMDVAYGLAWGPRLTKAAVLFTAAPYWDHVAYIMLGDELQLSAAEADAALVEFRNAVLAVGLEPRPIGVTFTPEYVLGNPDVLHADWDYIAIEAYTPDCRCATCGQGTPRDEIDAVAARTLQQEALIPSHIDLMMIMQGYDRNGAFEEIETLAALNRAQS